MNSAKGGLEINTDAVRPDYDTLAAFLLLMFYEQQVVPDTQKGSTGAFGNVEIVQGLAKEYMNYSINKDKIPRWLDSLTQLEFQRVFESNFFLRPDLQYKGKDNTTHQGIREKDNLKKFIEQEAKKRKIDLDIKTDVAQAIWDINDTVKVNVASIITADDLTPRGRYGTAPLPNLGDDEEEHNTSEMNGEEIMINGILANLEPDQRLFIEKKLQEHAAMLDFIKNNYNLLREDLRHDLPAVINSINSFIQLKDANLPNTLDLLKNAITTLNTIYDSIKKREE